MNPRPQRYAQATLGLFPDEPDQAQVRAQDRTAADEYRPDPDGADFPASMLLIRCDVIRNKLARAFGVQDHLRAIQNGRKWKAEEAAERATRVGTGRGLSLAVSAIGRKHGFGSF